MIITALKSFWLPYSLRLKTFIFSPQRRKGRKGAMPLFLCVLRAFAVNREARFNPQPLWLKTSLAT
jgi:hypothetical protein